MIPKHLLSDLEAVSSEELEAAAELYDAIAKPQPKQTLADWYDRMDGHGGVGE